MIHSKVEGRFVCDTRVLVSLAVPGEGLKRASETHELLRLLEERTHPPPLTCKGNHKTLVSTTHHEITNQQEPNEAKEEFLYGAPLDIYTSYPSIHSPKTGSTSLHSSRVLLEAFRRKVKLEVRDKF